MENQAGTPPPCQATNRGEGGRLGWAWAVRKGRGRVPTLEGQFFPGAGGGAGASAPASGSSAPLLETLR